MARATIDFFHLSIPYFGLRRLIIAAARLWRAIDRLAPLRYGADRVALTDPVNDARVERAIDRFLPR